jgi:uncharacterized lipoprotein YehR (DUF1307 family)
MQAFRAARFVAVAIMCAVVLAACGEQPTSATAPDSASYDGGHTFGGGNRSDSTTTTTTSTGGAVVDGGGITFGGGN